MQLSKLQASPRGADQQAVPWVQSFTLPVGFMAPQQYSRLVHGSKLHIYQHHLVCKCRVHDHPSLLLTMYDPDLGWFVNTSQFRSVSSTAAAVSLLPRRPHGPSRTISLYHAPCEYSMWHALSVVFRTTCRELIAVLKQMSELKPLAVLRIKRHSI